MQALSLLCKEYSWLSLSLCSAVPLSKIAGFHRVDKSHAYSDYSLLDYLTNFYWLAGLNIERANVEAIFSVSNKCLIDHMSCTKCGRRARLSYHTFTAATNGRSIQICLIDPELWPRSGLHFAIIPKDYWERVKGNHIP